MNKILGHLQHQVTISVKNDHEKRCNKAAEKIEIAAASSNNQRLFKLIHDSGIRNLVIETVESLRVRVPQIGGQQILRSPKLYRQSVYHSHSGTVAL